MNGELSLAARILSHSLTGMVWIEGPGIVTHYVYNTSVVLILPAVALYFASPAYFQYSFMSAHLDTTAKERLLQQSIATHPEYTPAYNALAWMYAEQASLQEALNLIETALHSEPDNHIYLDTKAEILYKLQRYEEAIEIEKVLVAQYPGVPFYQEQLKKYLLAKYSEENKILD
jgi:tetratricopeptide (TPR) repeat protein